MKVKIEHGTYILAVSGGVDSVTLLDLLSKKAGVKLVVAHFNHGIRPEAADDEQFVRSLSKAYKLPFHVGYGYLGMKASEERARTARYSFLKNLKNKCGADSIITAHHQDDLIETALLNLVRGTGPKGLSSMKLNPSVLRPLLKHSKESLVEYAQTNKLQWREDLSNSDNRYSRNYIRNVTLSNLDKQTRDILISNLENVAETQEALDISIAKLSQNIFDGKRINKTSFIALPSEVGTEIIVHWLRGLNIVDFDKKTINRLNLALRTGKSASVHPVRAGLNLRINKKTANFYQTA